QVRLVVPAIGLPTVWLHRGEYLPVAAAVLLTWGAVVLTGRAVRWARDERGPRGRRVAPNRWTRAAGPALGTVALVTVLATVAAPLATLTVAPFTGAFTIEGNRIAT